MKTARILCLIIILGLVLLCPLQASPTLENRVVKELDGQGRLKAILKYKEGRLVRKRIYHENGKLILDTVYKKGRPIVIKTYYLNGVLKSSWTQQSAQARFYFPNGQHNISIAVKNPDDLRH